MSLTQAGRNMMGLPQTNPILNPDGHVEPKQQRLRIAPGQYNGQRMDEILGGQVSKEYQKVTNPTMSQTLPPNQRANGNPQQDPMTQSDQGRFQNNNQAQRPYPIDPVNDRFTPQVQANKPVLPQRPLSQRRVNKPNQYNQQNAPQQFPVLQPSNGQQQQGYNGNNGYIPANTQLGSQQLNNNDYQPRQQAYVSIDGDKPRDYDRVIQQLMDSVQNLDRVLGSEVKRNTRQVLELERELRSKDQRGGEQPLNNQILVDLENKIYAMESRFIKEDRSKNELQQKLLLQDQNMKELMHFMKNLQSRDNNDMLQMRGMIQEKITEEGQGLAKEREKSKALFMEVVRLGEGHERLQESLNATTMQYEQRIQQLETKIYSGEKALVQVSQKGDTGLSYINDWNDKLERRVMMLESNIITLGKEQLKDRDQLARVDTMSQRTADEIKGILYTIQQDYQTRLEARATELINRIVMEHEQRVKTQDELRVNLELREKLNAERQQYEREEMRERLQSLEMVLRTDSQRKEEAIRQMSTLIETQVASIYSNIKNEEAQRYAHEIALRNDLLKIQENIKQENDLFKAHQSTITEKITDMIRVEVQNRLSSDIDLKNLTSAITSDIVADLNSLKDTIDSQNRKLVQTLKEVERDSAERSEKLSHYVDEEVEKISGGTARKYEKMKIIFTKLAEQFKQHLINTENIRQETDQRLKVVEHGTESIRSDFQVVLEELQEHLLVRLAEDKNEVLKFTSASIATIEDKTNKLESEQNKNFQIMREAIEENHAIFTEKMKLMLDQNETHQKQTHQQIELIVQGVSLVRQSIATLEQQLREQLMEMHKALDLVKDDVKALHVDLAEQVKRIDALQKLFDDQTEKIKELESDMQKCNESVKGFEERLTRLAEEQVAIHASIKQITETNQKIIENEKHITDSLDKVKLQIEEHSKEFDKVETQHTDLVAADLKSHDRIDEVVAQHLKDMETLKGFETAIGDRVLRVEDIEKKREIDIKELNHEVELMQDKIKTLTKLEN